MKLTLWNKAPLCLCLFFLLLPGALRAQVSAVNVDSLFQQAQQLAHKGAYAHSRVLAKQVLHLAPAYTDALLLVGSTYAWQHQYDSARAVLAPYIKQKPSTAEPYLVVANLELWDKKPAQSLNYADKGLLVAPASAALKMARAKALQALHRKSEATAALRTVLKSKPENAEAKALLEQIIKSGYSNSIRAEHQVTTFNQDISPWQLSSLEYTRVAAGGKYLARVNRAQRYDQQSLQAEVDAYPQLGEKSYAYLSVGISDEKLFPSYRAGAELYRLMPHKFEVSLGARALIYPSETVVLYTGYLGKYFRKQWVSFRPFLQKQDNNWQTTAILQVRQYLRHEEDYISLVLSKGSTPTTPVGFQEISRLDATRVGLDGQFRIGSRFLLGSTLAYEQEEYQAESFRNRFTMGLSALVKF